MIDDIVERLRSIPFGDDEAAWAAVADAADEIERLRCWKSEAIEVIEDWEAVWDAVGRPGALGQSKSLGLLGELGRLDDEIVRLRTENETFLNKISEYMQAVSVLAHQAHYAMNVVDALTARPFRGTPLERRDRMYGSDWEQVHDALDAWQEVMQWRSAATAKSANNSDDGAT